MELAGKDLFWHLPAYDFYSSRTALNKKFILSKVPTVVSLEHINGTLIILNYNFCPNLLRHSVEYIP